MATTLVDSVIHWRKKLDKNPVEDVILNVIRKLSKIPITLDILQVTHIGKTIRKLSKRDDIVGEKALAVLKKWRDAFANEESADKNSKPSVSKKENINKEKSSSKHDVPYEKTVHQKEAAALHEYKPKCESHLLSHSSSQQSPKKGINGNCSINNSNESSPSIYTYEKKTTKAKYLDYDPHADVSEGYNPECPELFPGDKTLKTKKPDSVDSYEPKSSQKRKFKTEEQTEYGNKSKKFKTESHSNSDSVDSSESKKSQEKKEKHKFHKDKSKVETHKSHSSSLKRESSDKAKSNSKHIEKHKPSSDIKKLKSKESNESSTTKSNKSKPKLKLNCSEEFTSSEVRFEDCLGFNDIVTLKKKKSSKSHTQLAAKKPATIVSNSSKSSVSSSPGQEIKASKDSSYTYKEKLHVNVPKPSTKLDVVDIISTLPETQPNYRPLPQRNMDSYSSKKKEVLTNEQAIKFTSSRREKTAVYSGRRNMYFQEVPSLFECCTRVLIENIDAIEYMGEVPYFLLKAVLERCTPVQLFNIENFNPHLIDSTNELWEIHCRRDYKLLSPEENETWRDLYLRAHDERERKLKSVTANISASMSKSNPVRQVKLAFVDSIAKPPRDVARRQAKNGTARPVNHTVKAEQPSKASPKPVAATVSSAASSSASTSFAPKKPKVAPLMAKTLKSMKQCFRR